MVVENYQINEPFLKDVLGTFYKGFEVETEKPIIIHCVDDTLANDPEFVDIYNAYLAEAAQLNIPNFAKAIYGGNKADILFTIYPNVDLIPLKRILSQNSILSIFDAPNLLEKISLSIRALHIEGVIHGVLSPESIFVDSKLERFEIFNAGSEKLIRHLLKKYPGNLQKILPFLSPEVLKPNTALQHQSDIYSLGVLFYTFLVGNTPWPDADFETLLSNRDSIVPPSLHRLEIPDFLDSLILDALETNPEKRIANLSLFLNSLAEAKSNILASFTPTSALIYGQFDEPAPAGIEESHTPDREDDHSEETNTSVGIIKTDEPEDFVQNIPETSEIQSDEFKTPDNLQTEESLVSHGQESQMISDTGEGDKIDPKKIINGGSSIPTEGGVVEEEILLEEGEGTPDNSAAKDYKEQLLNHENDFFSSELPESAIIQNASNDDSTNKKETLPEPEKDFAHFNNSLSDLKSDANEHHPHDQKPGSQASGLENEMEVDEFLSPKKIIPEIYTEDSSRKQEHELKFKTHQTSFPVLQINELDDRLSLKNYRDNQGAKEVQKVTDKAYQAKAQKAMAVRPSAQQLDAQQNKTIEPEKQYHPGELDNFDEKTATATEEFVAEKTNKKRKRFMRNVLKKVGIPLISVLSIYLLVLFMIDLGMSDGIKGIKENMQRSSKKTYTNQANPNPNKLENTAEQNNLQSSISSALTQNQNFAPINKLTQSINNNIQGLSGLPKNPLVNLKPRRKVTTVNPSSTNQIQKNSTLPPTRTLVDPEIANEAQLIIAVRNNTTPLVANVYLDGKLYGKTNNQGILSVPNLQKNQTYLLRIDKSGFEMFAREINLTRAGIETIDANLTETKIAISRAQLNNLGKQRNRQKTNLTENNRPEAKSTQEEFGTVNILLNNAEPISDALIHINGQLWQGNNYEAPAELQLPSGTYEIEIQKDGYISVPQSYTIDLLNGDYKTISFILTTF